MPMSEKQALLGHRKAMMTLHYTQADIERRRTYLAEMERQLAGNPTASKPMPQPSPIEWESESHYVN